MKLLRNITANGDNIYYEHTIHAISVYFMNTFRLAEEKQIDQGKEGQTNTYVDGKSLGSLYTVVAVDDDNDDHTNV